MTPMLATIGLVRGTGFMPWLIRLVTRSPYAHAFLWVGAGIVEAEPSGARAVPQHYGDVYWCTALSDRLLNAQRNLAVSWALAQTKTRGGKGTPYSFVDDAEIGFVSLFGWAPRWMRRRLASTRTLMCSQLCDAAYAAAGVQLFADGRPAGGVAPGDLWRLNEAAVRSTTTLGSAT